MFELPPHYGVTILGCGVAPMITSIVLGGNVMNARKELDVQYPNLYGVPGVHKNADAFNLIQRGHQNMLESALFYVPLSLAVGLKHPIVVGVGGFFYSYGCYNYQSGYKKSVEDRNKGMALCKYVGVLATLITALKVGFTTIL
jgi:glutathione S-transferase